MTETELVQGLKDDDLNALNYIYANWGPNVIGMIIKNNGTQEDGEDMLHTALLVVRAKIQSNEYVHQGKLRKYLFTTAYTAWLNILTRDKNKPTDLPPNISNFKDDSPEENYACFVKNLYLDTLSHILEESTDPHKILIEMYYFEGKKTKDIAKELGKTREYVSTNLHRCRERFKKLIEETVQKVLDG